MNDARAPENDEASTSSEGGDDDRESGPVALVGVPSSLVPPPSTGGIWWRLGGFVRMVRPHQWVKNVFVLAPVFFAKDLFNPQLFVRAAGAFGVFCLLAGAVYTINDLVDAEADRQHPVKRYRPIASGRVPPSMAKVAAVMLVGVGLAGAAYGPLAFLLTAASYFVLNLAYSFHLKKIAYLDVGLIATGFVLRVLAGGYGTQIHISGYLVLCTALLALFLGFGKRRHELAAAAHRAKKQRASLEAYTPRGLDLALGVTGVATVGTYIAYTLDSHTRQFFGSDHLWMTTVFVVWAVVRFLHLVRSRPRAESPTQEMLRDGPFVAAVLLWIMVVVWIVYNLRPS
jgi:decaprenyl-phosphate phosphoribosyltransferase